ncbi:hypothetical protein ACPUYX_04960 [Desulfosporosinus sp. SYSU MS00001]|uniref:hypothetical protein n=1 Tax=Desulfosporosinus sp. SYSU MS00001 TaxID=3416284 RepID=UPI003CEF15BB
MLNYLALVIVLGVLAAFSFIIFERARLMTGRKMLTEKLIDFLEKVYQRTDPQNKIEKDVQIYQLTERAFVTKVYFDDKK